MKQFPERGMDKAGIKLIGPGDVTDDDQLNDMGDAVPWAWSPRTTTRRPTSRPLNKTFRRGLRQANKGMRPNFMAVGGYDGMRVIYEALKATKGQAAAMLCWRP